jgi:hypothetical protein
MIRHAVLSGTIIKRSMSSIPEFLDPSARPTDGAADGDHERGVRLPVNSSIFLISAPSLKKRRNSLPVDGLLTSGRRAVDPSVL